MKNFDYHVPARLEDAIPILARGARAKSGGTDLLPLLKNRITAAKDVVSLTNIRDLSGIQHGAEEIWIGAGTTIADLVDDTELARVARGLTEAAEKTATPLVRNKATVGGNLCQRPRCWYFRHEDYQCLKRGGSMCYAQEGENKYHAIFENTMCAIVHPSNLAPALQALDATVHLASEEGTRKLAIDRLWARPEQSILSEVRLRDGEVVTAVSFARPSANSGSAYIEVREKQSYDWALVCCAARIVREGSKVREARVVLSAVAPTPLRRAAAEDVLVGEDFTEELAMEAGAAAAEGHRTLRDNGYKVRLVKAVVAHSLMTAFQRARA